MSRRILLLVAFLTLGALPARAGAPTPEELDLLLGTIRSNRQALVEVNLGLAAEERGRFQPVYESYDKELRAVQDRLFGVVEEYVSTYRELGDEKALSLIGSYLQAEEERTKIRRAYLERFQAVLPGRKVARFYQIENKMDALMRYELASRIPVIQE